MSDRSKEMESNQINLAKLDDEDDSVRREAVRNIGICEDNNLSVIIPLLIKKFEDENNIRREAVQALVKIGRRSDGIILPNLIEKLSDDSTLIRWGAAFTIGSLGKYAKNDIPTIISCIETEKQASVRKKLVWSLGKIGVRNEKVLDTLEKTMLDKKSEVRYKTAQAFGRIGGERAIEALLILLSDETAVVRATAAEAFKKVQKQALSKKEFLITALNNEEEPRRRYDIAYALFYLEDSYAIGLQELERQLELELLPKWQGIKIKKLLLKKKE